MNTKRLITSCFGLGFSPFAPGTVGSLLPCAVFIAIAALTPQLWPSQLALAGLTVFFSWATAAFSSHAIQLAGREDPSEVVSDEFAGQGLALLIGSFVSAFASYPLISIGILFLLFRFFDIAKIWPANRLESLLGGIGILADDIMAGLYAGIIFIIVSLFGWVHSAGELLNPCLFQICDYLSGLSGSIGLGFVQGLTEFLPVSSSGHLVMFETFIPSLDPESKEMLLFDLAVHVGTVFSIIVVFREGIALFARNLLSFHRTGLNPIQLYKKNFAWHFAFCAVITTITTVVIYKLFEEPLQGSRKLWLVCIMWLVTAALLYITDKKKRSRIRFHDFGIIGAVLIGVAQSGAIIPGISRSGATICAAILYGLHRKWAVEFSFLIAMPAILGGALLTALEHKELFGAGVLTPGVIVSGMLSACLTGIIALKLLIKASRKRKLKYFSIYCVFISAVSFIYLLLN
ncbi:Undecaprenyl-diphosphatase [Sedimentisphaera cyanobacteriorum]|uniref:Undecaprenyl-diphosphatase n=1 Tax=Sedimentisphaera cyanobacteriorum TaxID=1940790 RepID=A0A1Q2HL76_9BACT|nr:phosphatidylglycerophosphatase A [Sedimentisphaera cyanobacteriorum]AQQ08339.1 Undecaprenyl-diphosphatase [Sedimentisphaera cyanobacteriorum]